MRDGDNSQMRGREGEAKFTSLANRAGLNVSQLIPDAIGADRVVNFPVDRAPGPEPADVRQAQPSVVVQIKTVLRTSAGRVALSLSSCVPLKDDLRPAVICIAQSEPDGEITSLHLIHLIDKPLSRLLKRLREASKQNRDLNDVHITFAIDDGDAVEMQPEALAKALRALFGGDTPKQYADRKHHQVTTLGYGSDRYKVTTTVCAAFAEQAMEYMLGAAELQVVGVSVVERRFGIEMPRDPKVFFRKLPRRIKLTVKPQDQGLLVLSDLEGSETASVRCDCRFFRLGNQFKFRLTAPGMEFRYTRDDRRMNYGFVYSDGADDLRLRPAQWKELTGMSALYHRPKILEVWFKGDQSRHEFKFTTSLPGKEADAHFVEMRLLFEQLQRVEEVAKTELLVSPSEVQRYAHMVGWLDKVILGTNAPEDLRVLAMDGAGRAETDVLVVTPISIGGRHLAIATRARCVPVLSDANLQVTVMQVLDLQFLDIQPLDGAALAETTAFANRVMRIAGLNHVQFMEMLHLSHELTRMVLDGRLVKQPAPSFK